MEQRKESLVPPGTKLREVSWKKLIMSMQKRVEATSRRLLAGRKATDVRVEKKLGMMRLALLHQLQVKMTQEVDTKFFLEVIELINRAEELLEQYEHDVAEWKEFLEILEKKLEEEGLIVSDEELEEEARRMREAVLRLKAKLEKRPPLSPAE